MSCILNFRKMIAEVECYAAGCFCSSSSRNPLVAAGNQEGMWDSINFDA